MRRVLEAAPACPAALLLCSKGIEEASGHLLHQVARDVCPDASVMVLSGPTFAHEVAAGLPTALTLAAEVEAEAEAVRARLARPAFRIYLHRRRRGRRDRRRGQERPGDRVRSGRRQRARRQRAGGADCPRLCGDDPIRDRLWRAPRDPRRIVRARRPGPHLHVDQLAQLFARQGLGEGRPISELLSDRRGVAEGAFTAPVLARLAREGRHRHADRHRGRTRCYRGMPTSMPCSSSCWPAAAAGIAMTSEVDCDALLLPVAVAGGVEALLLAVGGELASVASGSGTGGDLLR
jgi:glycerol-3-phosphate dehydrogenase (NAD(P)+)